MRKYFLPITVYISILILFVNLTGCSKSEEELAREKFELGLQYKDAEQYFTASEIFEEIEISYPDYKEMENLKKEKKECLVEGYFQEAKDYIKEQKVDKALENIEKLLELDPDNIEGNYSVGFLYFQMAYNYAVMMQTPGVTSSDIGYLSAGVDTLMDLALMRFEKCLEIDDKHYAGHKGMGHYYTFQGDAEKAIEEMKLAVKYAEDEERKAVCRDALAQVYLNIGEIESAKSTIKTNLEEYPDRGDTYLTYANILYAVGELDKAIENSQKGLDLDFDIKYSNTQLYATLSLLYMKKKDYESAKNSIIKAIQSDPGNQDYIDQYSSIRSYLQ
jgi:tetratricopeptide (TPR) repeat protein